MLRHARDDVRIQAFGFGLIAYSDDGLCRFRCATGPETDSEQCERCNSCDATQRLHVIPFSALYGARRLYRLAERVKSPQRDNISQANRCLTLFVGKGPLGEASIIDEISGEALDSG